MTTSTLARMVRSTGSVLGRSVNTSWLPDTVMVLLLPYCAFSAARSCRRPPASCGGNSRQEGFCVVWDVPSPTKSSKSRDRGQ